MKTLDGAYHVRETRSFVRKNATAVGLTVATAILLVAAVAIAVVGVPRVRFFPRETFSILVEVVQ